MRKEIDTDADQHGGVQRRRSTFSLRKILPAMALVTSVSEAEAGATRLRQVVQSEEQREEGQRKKNYSGKEERAGEDGADGAGKTGVGANPVQVADRLHGRGGQHFAGGGGEHNGGDHQCGGQEAGLRGGEGRVIAAAPVHQSARGPR